MFLSKIGFSNNCFISSNNASLRKSAFNIFDSENNCLASVEVFGKFIVIFLRASLSYCHNKEGMFAFFRMIFMGLSNFDILNDIFKKEVFTKEEDEKKKSMKEDSKIKFKSISDSLPKKIDKEKIKDEMLSKVDYKQICAIVNSAIRRNNGRINLKFIGDDKIREWLVDWAEQKWKFYVLFGNEFKIVKNISIDKDNTEIVNDMCELCYKFPQYAHTLSNIQPESIKENTLHTNNIFYQPYYKDVVGTKLSKSLSKYFQNEKFDIEFSKLLQEKNTEAMLCVSIDPYDYLTMAINKHRWRSCLDFITGERNLGSASYMFDNTTVVSYMCSEKEYTYDDYNKWVGNSKRWRQLIHIDTDENALMFCREYPQGNPNEKISLTVRQFVEEYISKFCKIQDLWKIKFRGCISGKTHMSAEGSHHYEDFANTADRFSNHNYYVRHSGRKPEKLMVLGSAVKCPLCNKNKAINKNILCYNCIDELNGMTKKVKPEPQWEVRGIRPPNRDGDLYAYDVAQNPLARAVVNARNIDETAADGTQENPFPANEFIGGEGGPGLVATATHQHVRLRNPFVELVNQGPAEEIHDEDDEWGDDDEDEA